MAGTQIQSENPESLSVIIQSSQDVTANQTDSDDIFLILPRSTRAIGKIYDEPFDKSRVDFTTLLSESCNTTEVRYVRDMMLSLKKRPSKLLDP